LTDIFRLLLGNNSEIDRKMNGIFKGFSLYFEDTVFQDYFHI